jgi:hypothetical protein
MPKAKEDSVKKRRDIDLCQSTAMSRSDNTAYSEGARGAERNKGMQEPGCRLPTIKRIT